MLYVFAFSDYDNCYKSKYTHQVSEQLFSMPEFLIKLVLYKIKCLKNPLIFNATLNFEFSNNSISFMKL